MSLHLNHAYQIHSPISGLVCTGDFSGGLNGRKRPEMVRVICNPRTRQSFTLPRMNTRKGCEVRSFFGYDPVEKQFKVLSMTLSHGKDDATHQVSDARNWETFMEKDRMSEKIMSFIKVHEKIQRTLSDDPFYVFYYSLEKETIREVEIQGMEEFLKQRFEIQGTREFPKCRVYTFLNHVENVKLMKGVL
ncbi:hypothetical protein Bca4012_047471 [Brassica carinata]